MAEGSPDAVVTHTHEDLHFILVMSGEYRSAAQGSPARDRPLLVYNPPGTTHRDHFERGRGSFFSISLHPARARAALQDLALPQEPCYLKHPAQHGLAVSIAALCAQQRADLSLESLTLELIGTLEEGAQGSERMPPWMPRALELLHDCPADELSVRQVAEAAGIHPIHLARTFRRHFRCTPGAFSRFRRLEKAVSLLSSTTSPLTEVALASGFADQSHLTHALAQWLGVTPGQYRALTGPRDRSAPWRLQLDKTALGTWTKLGALAASARGRARRGR